jgi:hypothetical protein
LEWWQILLMALGCAFIFLVFLMCWRRRARRRRAQRTAAFAQAKDITPQGMSKWRWRLVQLGERVFGHKRNNAQTRGDIELGNTQEDRKLMQAKLLADAKHEQDMDKLIESYQRSLRRDWSRSSRAPTTKTKSTEKIERSDRSERSRHVYHHHHHHTQDLLDLGSDSEGGNRFSSGSLYSQVTGLPRRGPEAKQPVRDQQFTDSSHLHAQQHSRFSGSSWSSSSRSYYQRPEDLAPPPSKLTEAQTYVDEIRPTLHAAGTTQKQNTLAVSTSWLTHTHTGTSNVTAGSSNSRNPFRQPQAF